MATTLTPEQAEAIMAARAEPGRVMDSGMSKWEINFIDGKHCTMLSSDCRTKEAALLAAIERFGGKVKCVQ